MNEPKTPNLGLNKIDRSSPSTTNFDLDKYLDQNWEKIDNGVATKEDLEELREAVGEIDVPDASLTQKGLVQLSNKIDGTSETVAATEKAVSELQANIAENLLSHSNSLITGEIGAHGVRLLNGNLECFSGNKWNRVVNEAPLFTDSPQFVRKFLHVDNINGNDNNDGYTLLTALKTVKEAIKRAVKYYSDMVWIYCVTTVTEKIELLNINNLNSLSIYGFKYGDKGGLANPMARTPQITISGCQTEISISGFEIDRTLAGYRYGIIEIERSSKVNLSYLRNIISTGNPGIRVSSTTFTNLYESEISNKGSAVAVTYGSALYSHNLIGKGNTVALHADYGAIIIKEGSQSEATTLQTTTRGGVIK